jgi:hypothetical protein
LEKSVLTQFRFGFSLVSRGQYSALGVFLRRTRTTAREVTTFLVSCVWKGHPGDSNELERPRGGNGSAGKKVDVKE